MIAGLNFARLMVFFTTSVLIPIPVAYLSVSFKKTLKSPPQLVNVLPNTTDGKLNMSKKTIEVNSENFETNKKGIFAVGDICSYPGKLKLILSGFHEVALASVECFKRARPNEKYRFEFTTSSKAIQERLGKK